MVLLLACTDPSETVDTEKAVDSASDDTARDTSIDTATDTAGDTAGDTAVPCEIEWSFSGPQDGTELFSGTRYDWLLTVPSGAVASIDTSTCVSVSDTHRLCSYTPTTQQAVAIEVVSGECTDYGKFAINTRAAEGIWPNGERFPVMMYEATEEDMATLAAAGVNVVQAYVSLDDGTYESFAATAEAEGVQVVGAIRDAADFELLKDDTRIAFWSLPEEQRYWYPEEMAVITELSALIHGSDDRPVYMYLPGHYPPDDLLPYISYLDYIGAGAYVEYSAQPHVWARWRAESEVEAIESLGYTTAARVPLALPGTFDYEGESPTSEEAIHDSFAGLVGGAMGWFPFAWWHARYDAGSTATDGLLWVAERLGGADAAGEWMLHGEPTDVHWRAVAGETELRFTPMYLEEQTVPAQAVRGWTHHQELLVLVVNSSEAAATVTLMDMPGPYAWALGSGDFYTAVTGDDGLTFTVPLPGLGVVLLRVPQEPGGI